jgi:uncharacterized lipoprotein YmbA
MMRPDFGPDLRALLAIVVIALSGLAGCSTPASTERFYTLGDGGSPAASRQPAAPGVELPGIVISAVTVPDLIDRPQIVTVDGAHRVGISEQNLWAEPLKNGIGRALSARLARALAASGHEVRIAPYPQTSIAHPALRVTLDIQRFEGGPRGVAVVDVLWSVRRSSDGSQRTGRTVATQAIGGEGYDDIVRAWSQALAPLEADLTRAILASM